MVQDGDDEEPIPARMLNEVVYCPRLFYLEHVAGEWDDNVDTLQGKRVHRRVDGATSPLPSVDERGALPDDLRPARSVSVASPQEGIVAKCDLVEARDGALVPVDYKRGAAPDEERVPGRAWPADRVQVGAQALCLRSEGYRVDEAVLYYAESRTRVTVPVTNELVTEVRAAVAEARRVKRLPMAPPPLVGSPKCPRCSLVGICLPDELTWLRESEERARSDEASHAPAGAALATGHVPVDGDAADDTGADDAGADDEAEFDESAARGGRPGAGLGEGKAAVRKLLPTRDDEVPLYVQANGATIGLDGDCLRVKRRDGETQTVRLREVSQVNVLGNVTVTSPAMQALLQRGTDVAFFGFGGWHYGAVSAFSEKNVLLRIAQHAWSADEARCLAVAKRLVSGKIANSRTLLRRNASTDVSDVLARLRALATQATACDGVASLLGVEGTAARLYYGAYATLLRPRSGDGGAAGFDFEGRNRRPPRDPVNALLSFGYALLAKDCRIALRTVGFDPMVGLYHRPRQGKPALALDLMEEFRPLVVDSTVLSVVNTEEVQTSDFVRAAGGYALTDAGRRALIAAYERRMETEIKHPLFGYTVSYRRVLEVQARLLARTVLGELEAYPSFKTR
jgi:CRISPR-associated protein Cas1